MGIVLQLDDTWTGRPPTDEEHRAIERVRDALLADTRGWNRIVWRPPLQGPALVLKPECTTCSTQGLPMLINGAAVLNQPAGLRTQLDRLGRHACEAGD